MKKGMLVWFLILTLIVTACSSTKESEKTTTTSEETVIEEPVKSSDNDLSATEEAAKKAQEELDAAKAAEDEAIAATEKALEEKLLAEKLLAEAKNKEEQVAAEKLIAEKEAKLKASLETSKKAAEQKLALEKEKLQKINTQNETTKKSAPPIDNFNYNQSYTLTFWRGAPLAEDVQKLQRDLINRKFPNVQVEYVTNPPADIAAAGMKVDIYVQNVHFTPTYEDLGLFEPMDPYIKSRNVDLNLFSNNDLNIIRNYSDEKSLYGLPESYKQKNKYSGAAALFYNKNIFDRFGIPYPDKYMSWDAIIQIAAKFNRTSEGIQYSGLMVPGNIHQAMQQQLGINLIKKNGDSQALKDPKIEYMFKTIKAIYEANGNKIVSGDVNKFVKDNNVAMLALTNINPFFFNLDTPENRAFNWGVTYQPGLGSIPYVQGIFPVSFLSSTSKNKELVVEIMKYMALDDSAVAEAMKRFEPLEKTGKNLEPLYGKNYVPSNYIATRYTTEELKLSQKYVQDLYKGKDVNTILRQLDEELKSLAQKMKK